MSGGARPDTFVVRVDGDDMAPQFRRGDLVYVDPDASEEVGRFVAVRDEESGATEIRQRVEVEGRRALRALDGDRPDRVLDTDSESLIRGVGCSGGGKSEGGVACAGGQEGTESGGAGRRGQRSRYRAQLLKKGSIRLKANDIQ
jgi:hypothetical protein